MLIDNIGSIESNCRPSVLRFAKNMKLMIQLKDDSVTLPNLEIEY